MQLISMSAAVPGHVHIRRTGRESVLLNADTEYYFGLDEMGTRMWELVTTRPTVELAYQQLLEEFEVEPELLRSHLLELVRTLSENGLLDLRPSNVGTTPAV